MKSPLARLILDGGATVLLLLALAYWWLGNLTHELAGGALILLLGRHLVNNGFWWRQLRKGPYDIRRSIGLLLTLALALLMAAVLTTGIAVSRSLFAWVPLPENYALGEIHMFASYWVMVIIGLHIGFNWNRIAGLLRSLGVRGIGGGWLAWVPCLALTAQGLRSSAAMDLWTRLSFEYSPEMWDFNNQALGFFGHWLAIIAMFGTTMQAALLVLDRVARQRVVPAAERS